MKTMQLVATIATEAQPQGERDGAGTPEITASRPVNRPLRNDGVFRHWLAAGHVYQLRYDQVGWHVTSEHWTEREEGTHTYRLAEPLDGALRYDLPRADGGTLVLATDRDYELRQVSPGGAWALYTA